MPKMTKAKNCLITSWTKGVPELILIEEKVFCKACGKNVTCDRKFQITQHLGTELHKGNLRKMKESKMTQLPLKQALAEASKKHGQEEFNKDLCKALLSAGIPLKKVEHPIFKKFLEKYCDYKVPDESTLRKYC